MLSIWFPANYATAELHEEPCGFQQNEVEYSVAFMQQCSSIFTSDLINRALEKKTDHERQRYYLDTIVLPQKEKWPTCSKESFKSEVSYSQANGFGCGYITMDEYNIYQYITILTFHHTTSESSYLLDQVIYHP